MQPDQYAQPAFILSIVGLAIAIIGAAKGMSSLVWQIITRTRGAHRIQVRVTPKMKLIGAPVDLGLYLQIDVINRGAAAVQFKQWSIDMADGTGLVVMPAAFPPMPALPLMLEAGSSVSFYVPQESIRAAAKGRDLTRARAVAFLATGQKARGKRGEIVLD